MITAEEREDIVYRHLMELTAEEDAEVRSDSLYAPDMIAEEGRSDRVRGFMRGYVAGFRDNAVTLKDVEFIRDTLVSLGPAKDQCRQAWRKFYRKKYTR